MSHHFSLYTSVNILGILYLKKSNLRTFEKRIPPTRPIISYFTISMFIRFFSKVLIDLKKTFWYPDGRWLVFNETHYICYINIFWIVYIRQILFNVPIHFLILAKFETYSYRTSWNKIFWKILNSISTNFVLTANSSYFKYSLNSKIFCLGTKKIPTKSHTHWNRWNPKKNY